MQEELKKFNSFDFTAIEKQIEQLQDITAKKYLGICLNAAKKYHDKIAQALSYVPLNAEEQKKSIFKIIGNLKNILENQDNYIQSEVGSYPDRIISHYLEMQLLDPFLLLRKKLNATTQTDNKQEVEENLSIKARELKEQQNIFFDKTKNYRKVLNFYLKTIKQLAINEFYKFPKQCFIAYAWQEGHEEDAWIEKSFLPNLQKHLNKAGIFTILDRINNTGGNNIYHYENKINDSDVVIVIGTPSLLNKHDKAVSLVCNEFVLINRQRKKDEIKVLPILLSGTIETSFPPYFEAYTTIRDWRRFDYIENMKKIIQDLYSIPSGNKKYRKLWEEYENVPNGHCDCQKIWQQQKQEKTNVQNKEKLIKENSNKSCQNEEKSLGTISNIFDDPQNFVETKWYGQLTELIPFPTKINNKNTHGVAVALTGLAGSGKTETACYYLQRYIEKLSMNSINYVKPPVVWKISAEHTGTLIADYQLLAEELGVKVQRIANENEDIFVHKLTSIVNSKLKDRPFSLILFDNAPDFAKIKSFLPPNTVNVNVIVTSQQDSFFAQESARHNLLLHPAMTMDEGKNLLLKITGQPINSYSEDIVEKLEKLPLAMRVAAQYIQENNISYKKYLDSLQGEEKLLLAEETNIAKKMGYSTTQWTALVLVIQKIRQSVSEENINEDKEDMLLLCSMLPPENIAENVILRYLRNKYSKESDVAIKIRLSQVRQLLANYSLLVAEQSTESNESKIYYMHRMVQKVIRFHQEQQCLQDDNFNKTQIERLKLMIKTLNDLQPKQNTPIISQQMWVSQANCVFGNIKNGVIETIKEDLSVACMLRKMGTAYRDLGDLARGLEYLQEAVKIFEKNYSQDNKKYQEYVLTTNEIGGIYIERGEADKALEYFRKALNVAKQNESQKDIAIGYNNIGCYYRNKKNFPSAMKYVQKAKKIWKLYRKQGSYAPCLALSFHNIGTTYKCQKNYAQALKYAIKGQEIFEKCNVGNIIAAGLLDIGKIYLCQDKPDLTKALEYCERSKKFQSDQYGAQHPLIAQSYFAIGLIRLMQGNKNAAKKYFDKASAIARAGLGEEHPDTLFLQEVSLTKNYGEKFIQRCKEAVFHYQPYLNYEDYGVEITTESQNLAITTNEEKKKLAEKNCIDNEKQITSKNTASILKNSNDEKDKNIALNSDNESQEEYESDNNNQRNSTLNNSINFKKASAKRKRKTIEDEEVENSADESDNDSLCDLPPITIKAKKHFSNNTFCKTIPEIYKDKSTDKFKFTFFDKKNCYKKYKKENNCNGNTFYKINGETPKLMSKKIVTTINDNNDEQCIQNEDATVTPMSPTALTSSTIPTSKISPISPVSQ